MTEVDPLLDIAHTFESPGCPNRCGNGVSRSAEHPTWHCWRCRVDAVMVEYVVLRADDYAGAVADRDDLVSVFKTAADSLGNREPGVRNYLLNARATYGRQSDVTPREVTARADVARVEHLQRQMGDEDRG